MVRHVLLPLALTLALAACGKRAPLEVPPPPPERAAESAN